MRIEFLTQDDPLYLLPFFDEFLRHYGCQFEVTNISACRAMGSRPRLQFLKELTWLYGPLGFLRLLARIGTARVLGLLPRDQGAARFYSISQLCRAYGIAYRVIENPNGAEVVSSIAGRHPDLIVSVACPYILKEHLLKIPPLGCINIHHAPLPRYKGMMPTFWQMYHGETKVGLTIHYMAARVDEGDALFQDALEIQPGESLHHLIQRSKRHGAHAMAQVLRQVASSTQSTMALGESQGSYFTFPTVEQIREFRRRGLRAL